MKNLARNIDRENPQIDPEVQEEVSKELIEAGIKVNDIDCFIRNCGEVPTSIIGSSCGWIFKRAWRYYIASGDGIPPDIAEEFHKIWGKEVRVDGSAGCPSPLECNKGFAVGLYHIDTQEGLNAFVKLLKSIYKG